MAVETQGAQQQREGKEEDLLGEEFLYFIKGATLRASRSARRQRPHQAADGSARKRGRRATGRAI
jgi:hypothetical protein